METSGTVQSRALAKTTTYLPLSVLLCRIWAGTAGAAQVWANSLADSPGAVKAYRKALSLGGTVTLPELFATAGAKFSFDAATLKRSVDLMEQTIEELESGL